MARTARASAPAQLPVEEVVTAHAIQRAGVDGIDVMAAMRDAGSAGIIVGRYQMARAMANLSRVAMLRAYEQLKANSAYKALTLLDDLGNPVQADTLQSFCLLAFQQSYRTMEEDLQNLKDLGDALYDCAETLCLRRDDMRALRALPAPERAKVDAAVAAGAETKQIRALITDLVEDLAAARRQADASAAKLNEMDEVVRSQAADLANAKREIKSIKSYVPSDDAAAQSKHDEVTINACKEAIDTIMAASETIGQILLDAKRDPRLSLPALQVIGGMVEGELRRWYSYSDMVRTAAEARK
ncbi:MAG: hypothetical protein LW835_17135 [Burkholderiaceae bacterium]|nr:hypothetical protein [Burkholderiaceae bacterium]